MQIEQITDKEFNILDFIDKINIAEELEQDTLDKISQQVSKQYEADKDTRQKKEEIIEEALTLASQIQEPTNYPWEGASNTIYPLLTQASIESNSEAYPAIIQDGNVVKVKVVGSDDGEVLIDPATNTPMIDPATQQPIVLVPAGIKNETSERVKEFTNHYIIKEIKGWEENEDRLLRTLPIVGTMFKKIYYDVISQTIVSDLIFSKYCIVNDNAKSINDAFAITHEYTLMLNDIISNQRAGIFLECDLMLSNQGLEPLIKENDDENYDDDNLENTPQVILEQHTYLDLDNDGYKEPYIITIHKESKKLLRIVARFTKENIQKENGKIIKITPTNYFVKYSFIPSIDGSFYDIGFADFLKPLNEDINKILNQLINAGELANTSQGFIGSGLKMKGGDVEMSMGKFKFVNNMGVDIANNIFQLKHPEPSMVLFNLLGLLLDAGKLLANQKDVLSGMQSANIAPTTMIAQIEQGYKEFKAIYKRQYRSLNEEFDLIIKLIKENVDNTLYQKVLNKQQINISKDFESTGINILPIADPNMITSLEKMAQSQFLMQFIGNPLLNQQEILKRIFTTTGIDKVEDLFLPPQPPMPDPKIEVEMAKLQQKQAESMADIQLKENKLQLEAQKLAMEQQKKDYELEIKALKESNELNRVKQAQAKGMVDAYNADTKREESIANINLTKAQTEKTLAEAKTIETGQEAENGRQDLRNETESNI